MNLDDIWMIFLTHFNEHRAIEQVIFKKITNIPFLYINTSIERRKIDELLEASSIFATSNTNATWRSSFVRSQHLTYVYQHRFYVPQRKMACCGNSCADCIRFIQ
ncbi:MULTISPECIES: hypothetical protein [Priestia]|jgi:hypothetical protein|uniref:Uncharacterized protein n=1 Tax=Priestia aryabhattai TaxID=412384 RepID=A0ABD7WTA6_PRIAR|nr:MULTISPECIES: hypothetical protein [Priestia]MBK0008115.1 hypothetical protein [Bacillus sp. S35]KJL04095.1 hypothetical protein N178_13690 [Priestia aryabhattai B8W22]MBU3572648.1 hypothetical protein [Priestia aryabhattai]MBX4161812.1 hypothetical protein [Priestia megaterium]MBY0026663.1 hypothetical protein [Priestia aryabhattai]